MNSFPFLTYPTGPLPEPPLFQEWAYNFRDEHMILTDGRTTLLSGQDALQVWIFKAVRTIKARYRAYSKHFGSELESLIGTLYSPAATQAEAQRMVTEALEQSRYILTIDHVAVYWEMEGLHLDCALTTVYGPLLIDRVL